MSDKRKLFEKVAAQMPAELRELLEKNGGLASPEQVANAIQTAHLIAEQVMTHIVFLLLTQPDRIHTCTVKLVPTNAANEADAAKEVERLISNGSLDPAGAIGVAAYNIHQKPKGEAVKDDLNAPAPNQKPGRA